MISYIYLEKNTRMTFPERSSILQLESAGRILKVTEANLEDSGKYTCLATNAAGEAQQHIRLSVYGRRCTKHFVFLPISPYYLRFF